MGEDVTVLLPSPQLHLPCLFSAMHGYPGMHPVTSPACMQALAEGTLLPAAPPHTGEGPMAQPCSQDSGDSTCGPAAPHVSVVWTADAMPHMLTRHERARAHMCREQRAESSEQRAGP